MSHDTCYSESLISLEGRITGWEDKTQLDLKKPNTSGDFYPGHKIHSLVWNPEAKEFYPTKRETENSIKLTENPVASVLTAVPSPYFECEHLSAQRETVH